MLSSSSNSRLRLVPIILAQVVGLACGLVGLRLSSHLVPPAILGIYGLFLTFAPVGMWLVYVGLLKYVSRHWASTIERESLRRSILRAWVRRVPWLVFLAAIPAMALTQLSVIERLLLGVTLLVSAGLLTLTALAQVALQADRAHWRDCAAAALGSVTRSFIPPLLYAFSGGIASLWLGFTTHALLTAMAAGCLLRASFKTTANSSGVGHPSWKVYEGPLFTALAIANLVVLGLNRWLVVWFFGEQEAGYFTLVGGAVTIVTSMLATVLIQYLQPELFALGDRVSENRPALARKVDLIAFLYTAIGLAGVATLSAVAPQLVGPLISTEYRDALPWIFPAGCFGLTVSLGLFYHTMLLAGRRERACGPVDLATAAVLVAGCIGAASLGRDWLMRWLMVTPLVSWLLTRPLARRYFLRPAGGPAPAPARPETCG
jgi:hypothetical protein